MLRRSGVGAGGRISPLVRYNADVRSASALAFLLGCGAVASPAPEAPATDTSSTVNDGSATRAAAELGLSADDLALLDLWSPIAVDACADAAPPLGSVGAWTAWPRFPPPCGLETDAAWGESSVIAVPSETRASSCWSCSYEAAARTVMCDLGFGTVRWTYDASGHETSAEGRDRRGHVQLTSTTTLEPDGWDLVTTTEQGEWAPQTTVVRRRHTITDRIDLLEIDEGADGTIDQTRRVERDEHGVIVLEEASYFGISRRLTECVTSGPSSYDCHGGERSTGRLALDASGHLALEEHSFDGTVSRVLERRWHDDLVVLEEDWRPPRDGGPLELARRVVSDGDRSVTTEPRYGGGRYVSYAVARSHVCAD